MLSYKSFLLNQVSLNSIKLKTKYKVREPFFSTTRIAKALRVNCIFVSIIPSFWHLFDATCETCLWQFYDVCKKSKIPQRNAPFVQGK